MIEFWKSILAALLATIVAAPIIYIWFKSCLRFWDWYFKKYPPK